MPQTVIRAPESTENIPSARRVRDVARRLAYVDPDVTPLTVILVRASGRSRVAINSKFEWFEKGLPARWDAINNAAGYGAANTSLVVDNAAYFSVGDLVDVPRTGEVMRVTAVDTGTNTLTVTRSVGSTAAAALNDNEDLLIIGNAYAEGASAGAEKSHQETNPFNYTQIVRTPFGVTGTEAESENYIGPDRPRLRAEKGVEHRLDLERTALFGERAIDTTSTDNPIRYTGGLLEFLSQNVKAMGGVMTEPELEQWAQDVFQHTASGNSRLLMASPLAVSVLNQLAAARLQTVSKEKVFGLSIVQWITAHGTFNIVKHRLLENGPTTGDGYGGYMIAVDPNKITYRFMRNRNTKLRMDIQANDLDGFKDEYLTEMGWQIETPEVHGVATGITG